MAGSRKRPRVEQADESNAECPFRIVSATTNEKDQKKKKRRKGGAEEQEPRRTLIQMSPFSPSGSFKTHENLDMHYGIEPYRTWGEMTRYNSFVLNGVKYFSEGFIYIANENTIERQKAINNKESLQPRKKMEDDWVARILEIRAKDEHHVYARVYWMYWPEDLPAGTIDGKKTNPGRQPYHGQNELVASNHMDIINVVSVTAPVTVNQWYEENDDDVQDSLYWRQALDIRTNELSTVELTCKCKNPANPDKTLVNCTNEECSSWLHDDCLKHEALMKTFKKLGKDKPYKPELAPSSDSDGDGETGPKRPLSPTEMGGTVSTQAIDVKAGSEEKKGTPMDVDSDNGGAEGVDGKRAAGSGVGSVKMLGLSRGKKRASDGVSWPTEGPQPYDGLFEAQLLTRVNPPLVEITDLRGNVTGGVKTWTQPLYCSLCSTEIH